MAHEERLEAYFKAHTEEFLQDLRELIAIPSVKGAAKADAPFGVEPARALACALGMAKKYGLFAENWENYIGIIQTEPGKRRLDIFAHLDVVPADGNWTVSEPFSMKMQNGRLYGRGTADDKGPALAALYALRAIKDLHIPLSKGVRLVLGTDEECGSADLAYYFRREAAAEMSFSPDAYYPVINAEKGRLVGTLSCKCSEKIKAIRAGTTVNIIPETAEAVLQGVDRAQLLSVAQKLDTSVEARLDGDFLHVYVQGVSAHAASPEEGINPVTALVTLLAECTEDPAMRRLHRLFPHGENNGRSFGVDEDGFSGRTTLSLTFLDCQDGVLTAKFDGRLPVYISPKQVEAVRSMAEENGFSYAASYTEPHYISPDTEIVQTLCRCYERVTGEEGKPMAIGGGTYAHGIPNAVAFGCALKHMDNHMHGNNEFAELQTLQLSQQIFAQAIIDLCG